MYKSQQKLKPGTHTCSIYRNVDEQMEVLVPFILGGLQNNQKCVCVVKKETREMLSRVLNSVGLDVKRCTEWGQFVFMNPGETYLQGGCFDPENTLHRLREHELETVREGFSGIRGTGEMFWSNMEIPGIERVIEYEAKLNNFCSKSPSTFLCQYPEALTGEDILRDVIYTHPVVSLYGSMRDNPYYIQPDDFLKGFNRGSGCTYESMRDCLRG